MLTDTLTSSADGNKRSTGEASEADEALYNTQSADSTSMPQNLASEHQVIKKGSATE